MQMTRRELLKASAAFGAFNIVPAKVLWGAEAPSNQLTRALIGFGGEGHTTFTIAGPTGEGITSAKSFTRQRRCVMADSFRII